MKKNQVVILVLAAVVIAGGWYARYRFGAPKKTTTPREIISIAQARLPLADYKKIPQGFPAQMILGTEAKIIESRTQYLGGATLLQVRAKSPDAADFLLAEYEKSFKMDGYAAVTTKISDRVTDIVGTKGREEMQVGIVRGLKEADGSLLNLKYIVTFK